MADPYFIGDSIAEGLKTAARGQGDTKVGRSPAQVLQAIQNAPSLNGRKIVLSTGLSNNPGDMASVAQQFEALRAKGVNPSDISVVGLGSRFDNLNPTLGKLVTQQGANFSGGFRAGADGVHPASYGDALHSVFSSPPSGAPPGASPGASGTNASGDDFGPNGVYSNIPRLDSKGRLQLPMFMRWNPDPVGNDATNLAALSPGLQKVITQARADNPNLNFVIGNGKRSAADQDQAKAWSWSQAGSKDGGDANVHMQGNAVDLWGLDSNGHVQFDPDQQQQISQAMQAAAKKVGVGVNWGGNWKNFKDAPHFELAGGGTAASSGSPEGPPAQTPATTQSTPGTTINSTAAQPQNTSAIIDTLSRNIASIESGGFKNPYEALNPRTHAIGKYQVMPANVPGWTQAALGHSMKPEEFMASPAAQEAVFRDQMQRSLQLYGPKDAASIWFTGKPYNVAGGNVSDGITKNADYVARATAGLDGGATFTPSQPPGPIDPSIIARGGTSPPIPGTTINGAPATPAAPDAANNNNFPGFTTKSASDDFLKNATALDKAIHGDQSSGQDDPKAAAFNFLPARNVSPLLGMSSQIYGNTLTSMAAPAQWSSAAPGQNPYANVGGQPIGGQFGTQLGSMQQLQQMMAMMGNPYGDGGYG